MIHQDMQNYCRCCIMIMPVAECKLCCDNCDRKSSELLQVGSISVVSLGQRPTHATHHIKFSKNMDLIARKVQNVHVKYLA